MPKHLKTIDILGTFYGNLQIIADLGVTKHKRFVLVKCVCGVEKKVRLNCLRMGRAKSCGCLKYSKKPLLKHGMARHKLFTVWVNMRQRCYSDKNRDYKSYGGRGISVCKEWDKDFLCFYNWCIDNGWKDLGHKSLSIERIDVNGNYEPSNCKIIPYSEQVYNKRTTFYVEYNGERKSLSLWCKDFGLKYKITHQRMKRDKMQFEDIIKLNQ